MQIKRRSISLLLIFAMMTVALVLLLPLTASADPVGDHASDIQNFNYQTLSGANQTDATTDLRVMFTIGSLDYDEVGFVFSTSNPTPTAGGSGTYSTTTVYSTINAGGDDVPAGSGRFWVAVKLHNIPLASFETPIYIRPFVKDGENYSYIDAATITVCQALTFDKTVEGESLLWNSKAPTEGPVYYRYNAGTDTYSISKTIGEIRGSKHFFPTDEDPTVKSLYFEYSFLWNPTLANTADARFSLASFKGGLGDCELFGLYTKAGDGRSAGQFDLTMTSVYYNSSGGIYSGATEVAAYQTLGAQYGWHRIGIRFDNYVISTTNGQAKADGHGVQYYGISELYVDGVRVWQIRANVQGDYYTTTENEKTVYKWRHNNCFRPNFAMPFLAIKNGISLTSQFDNGAGTLYDGVWYVELDNVNVKMTMNNISQSEDPVYIAVSDVHWSCGTAFRRKVSPVADPRDRTIVLDDKGTADPSDDVTCSGKIWYVFDN